MKIETLRMPIGRARKLTRETLRQLKEIIVIEDSGTPLAALVPYATYLDMQRMIHAYEHDGGAPAKAGWGRR